MSCCNNPNIDKLGDDFIFCYNCYQSFKEEEEEDETPKRANIYQCCESPNIYYGDQNDICINCGSIHQKNDK